jgi:predicted Rossmann-fold nucleotide-binding protein
VTRPSVSVFAGCLPQRDDELGLAREVGLVLAPLAGEVRMGGYNGLMEELAAACTAAGGVVVAPRLAGRDEWGAMNPHVSSVVECATPGERLDYYLSADILLALPGGVGSLYELAAALWYTTTYGQKPVLLLGERCRELYELLVGDGWIVETPTRPIDHIVVLDGPRELEAALRVSVEAMSVRRTS